MFLYMYYNYIAWIEDLNRKLDNIHFIRILVMVPAQNITLKCEEDFAFTFIVGRHCQAPSKKAPGGQFLSRKHRQMVLQNNVFIHKDFFTDVA